MSQSISESNQNNVDVRFVAVAALFDVKVLRDSSHCGDYGVTFEIRYRTLMPVLSIVQNQTKQKPSSEKQATNVISRILSQQTNSK